MGECAKCGHTSLKLEILGEYRDVRIGISGVVLYEAAFAWVCEACGHLAEVVIPNLQGLVAAVAVTRVTTPMKLNGEAIRFLRRAVEWTGKQLADKLGVTPETVSRWETGALPIGPSNEKLLRVFVGLRLHELAPVIPFDADMIEAMTIPPGVRSADLQEEPPVMGFRLVECDGADAPGGGGDGDNPPLRPGGDDNKAWATG